MSGNVMMRLYNGSQYMEEQDCTGLSLEREAYTPYTSVTATFRTKEKQYGNVRSVTLYIDNGRVYEGLLDTLEQFWKDGVFFVRVKSRSFTSVLVQNELESGLHANLTLAGLMTGFYSLPHVLYEDYAGTGYIFVKEGSTLWDSIVNFCYKISGRYPYVYGNTVRLTPHSYAKETVLTPDMVLGYGTGRELSRLIHTFHMEDVEGNADGYMLTDSMAADADIVRHRYMGMDRQYLSDLPKALEFRQKYARRAMQSKYVEYSGFRNECICDYIQYGTFLPKSLIGRVRMTYGKDGMRTRIWAYDDGFYTIGNIPAV